MEDRIIADCGGEDNLTTVQRTLITAFCAVSLQLSDLNVKALLGQPVSLGELSLAAGTLKRLAGSIGLARVPKEVTTLDAYIRAKYPQQPTSEIA